MSAAPRLLHSGFLRSAAEHPDRPALEVGGGPLTYAELNERATRIAATLQARAPEAAGDPPLTAVFAYRSPTAFAGVLGALIRGHGYVPLNRTVPVARSRSMLERSGCRAVVVDEGSAPQLPALLDGLEPGMLVLCPDVDDGALISTGIEGHEVLGRCDLAEADAWDQPAGDPDAIAYLLFTSGSTGVPKGVMVAHRNTFNYLDFLSERYSIGPEDRLSNTHDMTFDISVMDMFLAWENGACVCCVPEPSLIRPGPFIRDSRLTLWAAVPSTAVFMRRLGMLKAGSYPGLRWILCAGEPLPLELAEAYIEAAPNATLENLYGPTEATIEVTYYRFDRERSPAESEHGVVPMGAPFPNMTPLVVDEELREVAPGEKGEFLIAGPQVSLGYWQDPERTAQSFVVPPGRSERFYRTGDLVRRPANEGQPIPYLGRIDNQIKIRGVRVELGEVEAAIREVAAVDAVVALGWPRTASGADAIVAFVGDEGVDGEAVTAALSERLSPQMVPRRIVGLPELPLNPNGKFDRGALERMLNQE